MASKSKAKPKTPVRSAVAFRFFNGTPEALVSAADGSEWGPR